jgi:hypothetical protein
MKKGSSSINGSELDKNSIIKPTFDTLMEEGRKTLKGYRTDLEELFYSCYEVTWQGGRPQGRNNDHHPQGRGNTRGVA